MARGFSFHPADTRLVTSVVFLWLGVSTLSGLLAVFGPPLLPLWYSLPIAADQLAPREYALSLAGVSTAILLFALLCGRKTTLEHESYLAHLGLWTGVLLLGILGIATLRIIFLVL